MELASRSLIEELASTGHIQATHTRRDVLLPSPAPVHRSRQCKCGTCRLCRENARWERIFQAKFADPSYYQERPPRHGSSLAWL
jgi:hypothetical protein